MAVAAIAVGALAAATIALRIGTTAGAGAAAGDAPAVSRRGARIGVEPGQPLASREPAAATRVDIARVEAALARLGETTARISSAQLAEEQQRMLDAKARFEAIQVQEPTTRPFTDEQGTRWIELRHASGEVRYALAPEEPAPTDVAGAGDAK